MELKPSTRLKLYTTMSSYQESVQEPQVDALQHHGRTSGIPNQRDAH